MRANIAIDTERLRDLIELHAGEHIREMDLESLGKAREILTQICFEQEGGTLEKACLREAVAWMNEKILERIMEEKA